MDKKKHVDEGNAESPKNEFKIKVIYELIWEYIVSQSKYRNFLW